MKALGRHLVADFHGCAVDLNDPELVMDTLIKACEVAGATLKECTRHHFSPYGVTAVVIIAESHLAVHTWPEYDFAAVDLFTCGVEVDTIKAFDFIKEAFRATRVELKDIPRGILTKAETDGRSSVGPPLVRVVAR
ncbi:MAG: adenosylmethionine decarboxylase [Deltaproteobacteria bacterium]|nr:adenosylmethionine decarboxylase [Deltaproteobacteria bacterium]